MNNDRDTLDRTEGQQTGADAGSVEISPMPPLPAEPVPAPSSAPVEFLNSQWLGTLPASRIHRTAKELLAPPPASAPGEFLSAQWIAGVLPDLPTAHTDLEAFKNALPETLDSSSHLENLAADVVVPKDSSAAAEERATGRGPESSPARVRPARVREVALAPDEEISMVFLPDEGVVDSVPRFGQALVLTSHRLIAFRGVEGFRDTHMAMASEISQCSVRTGQRNWGAILQGLMIMVGGAFLYLIVGYWLAGQIGGPNVPVLNIDVAPLIALLIILAGLFVLASHYFMRPAGALIFHGDGVEITFPFRSSLGPAEVYDFVNTAHSMRWRGNSAEPGGDRPGGDQ